MGLYLQVNFSFLLVHFLRSGKCSILPFLHGSGSCVLNSIWLLLIRWKDTCPWRTCAISNQEEDCIRSLTWKEDSNDLQREEPVDCGTLVCPEHEVNHYDFHIVYSSSYRVPVLYFRSYHSDGQLLSFNEIEKDLPCNSAKLLSESKWTFITNEEHPHLNRPWYKLHPCGTSEWMKLLFDGDSSLNRNGLVIERYLVSWFSVIGQVVGLKIPLEMLDTVVSNDS
ncbi:ubiquitin-like-conjugating enzyme ATG10 isoform X2 [Vigna umbellata]|uniref:ubiquitin-like-conjugating enzyme ATG10 isoform X2 n=1 Tax=Vigna umbellata TaxID=87088 RepID=UPI001F5F656E|nr:ubiquitin-like-conjugating enzyme ATG10 isoform X2 [Vigna umbellata]XP_047172373.1 ubiquitin-like-conjugating enzyme ATG10 isoform X2 [Vigna umbellata]XP_047172375.1 ubiquitin-like-conjugating enzyme ATG10 isoform X2 [Vigna umbellata]